MTTTKLAPAGGPASATTAPAGALSRYYDALEAAYLSQPENRLTDEHCDLCNSSPCCCDRLTDDYRDRNED